jgi:hypothetical protein
MVGIPALAEIFENLVTYYVFLLSNAPGDEELPCRSIVPILGILTNCAQNAKIREQMETIK